MAMRKRCVISSITGNSQCFLLANFNVESWFGHLAVLIRIMCINLEVDWQIGDALQELFKEGIVTRGDLWITSKLWSVLIQPSLLS